MLTPLFIAAAIATACSVFIANLLAPRPRNGREYLHRAARFCLFAAAGASAVRASYPGHVVLPEQLVLMLSLAVFYVMRVIEDLGRFDTLDTRRK